MSAGKRMTLHFPIIVSRCVCTVSKKPGVGGTPPKRKPYSQRMKGKWGLTKRDSGLNLARLLIGCVATLAIYTTSQAQTLRSLACFCNLTMRYPGCSGSKVKPYTRAPLKEKSFELYGWLNYLLN